MILEVETRLHNADTEIFSREYRFELLLAILYATCFSQVMLNFVNGDPLASIELSDLPAGYDRQWVRFVAVEDERVYGGGEQFTYLNMRGRTFPIWTREQG